MLEDLQKLRDDVSEAIDQVLRNTDFENLDIDVRRDFWREYLYEQGYSSTEDDKEQLKLQAQAASIQKARSELEAEEEKLKKLKLDDEERRKLRQSWGPSVRNAFICTLTITMLVIASYWIVDLTNLRSNGSADPNSIIVNQTIIVALITATVAEAAAMALIITRWGFDSDTE